MYDINKRKLKKNSKNNFITVQVLVLSRLTLSVFHLLQKYIVLLNNRRPEIKDLDRYGKTLTEKTGSPEWQEKAAAVHLKFNVMETKLQEREDIMEKVVYYIEIYTTSTGHLESYIPKIKEEISNLAPISTEPDEIQEQLQDAEKLQATLVDDRISLESAQEAADWLATNCDCEPEQEERMKTRVRVSKEALDELIAANNDRQNALKCALMQSKEFKSASNDFIIWLNAVEDRLSSQPAVASDTESIRELKKDHVVSSSKAFRQTILVFVS